MKLDDKVAIVTGAGGAGVGGLGVVYAQALAEAGAAVVVSDIDGDAAERVASDLVTRGYHAIGVRADVSVEPDVISMVAAGEEAFGGIDILVNNAGLVRGKWSEGLELSAEDWKTIMAVNTLAPLLCTRACRASMVARGGGVVVNQTSMAAYMEAGAYSVTKLALIGMTRVLSAELGSDNIRVNAIAPGVMTAQIPQDLLEAQLAMQKIERQGTPQDLVGALLFLCSERSSFITGQTLLIDGGAIRGRI